MEYKYNFNLLIITKNYLFFLVTLLNIFAIKCSGLNCGKKIISETNKCVDKCPKDTYELGDYCYYRCPADKNMENDYTKMHKSCKCKENYFLHKKEMNGKNEFDCVEICPTQFYDYETKKCVNDCGNKLTHIDRDNVGNEKQKRCSKKCLTSEFLKKDQNSCLDTCDYYLKEKDTKICLEKCDDGYIYGTPNSKGERECMLHCGQDEVIALVSIHPEEKKRKQCFNREEATQFYKYNDIYFENCKDTYEVFNIKTFQYKNQTSDEQICVDSCSKTDKQFISSENECIDNCGQDFHYNKYCLKECFRLNYNMDYSTIDKNKNVINELIDNENIPDEDTIDFNQLPEEKECLERCPSGTLTDKDERKCYITACPEGKFINSNHECIQECENGVIEQKTILKSIKKIGGRGPDEIFYSVTKKFCLNSCPDNSPYFYNDKCYNVSCKEMNKYSTYDYPFICYDSCEEVKGYNDEKDFICHKTQLRKLEELKCDDHYYMDGDKKICITLSQCLDGVNDKTFKYEKDKECTNNCNGYIIENAINNKLGQCFDYITECINKEYNVIVLDNNLKTCKKECDTGHDFLEIKNYYSNKADFCSKSCPNDYPYKDGTKCVQVCDKFYDGTTCTDECIGKYRFEDSKECVDNCTKNGKTFYIRGALNSDKENICYYSCNNSYSYLSDSGSNNTGLYIKCVESCGTGTYKYYYEDKKICLDSCTLHESESSYKCVYSCKDNEKVIKKDNLYYCTSSTCTNYIEKQTISSILMEVCVNNCNTVEYPLKSTTTKYCLKECPVNESYIYGDKCYAKCPNGIYADELDKKCMDVECPNNSRTYYEIINESDNIKICREKCPGDRFILNFKGTNINPKGECVKICPKGNNYIQNKIICSDICPDDLYPVEIATKGDYSIYNCSQNCGDKFTIYGEKKCVDKCEGDYKYESPDRICYKDNCQRNTEYPFTINSDKKVCAKKCDDSQPFYESEEKICKSSCESDGKKIYDYDNECVGECKKLNYLYYNEEEENGKTKTKCVAECPESKKYYDVNKTCVKTCPETYNYVKENKCVTKSEFSCNKDQFEKTNKVTKEVECVLKCDDNQYYYEDKRICIDDCESKAHFKIQGTQICITKEECPNPYYSYHYEENKEGKQSYDSNMCLLKCPTDKPYIDNRKCVVNCPQTGNNLHVYGDINCINMCPIGSVKDDDVCTSVCPEGKFLDYLGKDCIEECDSNYPYHVKGVNQCIRDCPQSYYKEEKECVTSCSETKYLVDSLYCKDSCDEGKNFVLNKNCSDECPEGFPIFKYDSEKKIYNCLKECGDHLYPDDECKSACNETYPYYNYDNGTCLKQCPLFYVGKEGDSVDDKKCYKQCPSTHPYYYLDSEYPIECLRECNSDSETYINMTNHLCQKNCAFKVFKDGDVQYCLKDCNDLGLLTNGKVCIKSCLDLGENYNLNPDTNTCECPNLYYNDANGNKVCLLLTINDCPKDYEYRKNGEKECLSNCKGHILSNDEKICYYDDIATFKCPLVTESIKSYNDKNIAAYKCDCPAKFYKENEKKVCLSEHEDCPSNYKYYKPDINECVKEEDCTEGYCKIENVNLCLIKIDNCGPKWKKVNEEKYIAVNSCDKNDKYYEMDGTDICVQNCQNTTHFIFHDDKCISSCSGIEYSELYKIPSSSLGENPLSLYKCRCANLWTTEGGQIKCMDPEKKECDGELKKVIDTNECVQGCDFEFNGECFANCDEVKKYYPGFEYIKVESEKKCRCNGLWMKVGEKKVECIKGDMCPKQKKFLDFETKECSETESCNGKKFNNICYKNCELEKNAEDSSDESCKCKYNWYQYNNEFLGFENYKVCLEEGIPCPEEYPYINKNKECIKSLEECEYVFNNQCVESCAGNTKLKDSNSKICVCDPDKGSWYQDTDKDGKAILICGVESCPSNKSFIDDETNECQISCSADKFIHNKNCVESCPGKTKVLDQISKICEDILIFDNEEEMENLEDLKEKVDGSIKDLYGKRKEFGLVYNIDSSTMQFYGVNKNKETNKDSIIRSNLTYIDISKCLDKLYKKYSDDLGEDGEIIIVKYDIGDITNSTTINPVEYKLVNSNTGEELKMDVCEDNSILISYPLSSILNNFPLRNKKSRKLQELQETEVGDILDLNFREKFLLGKELFLQDNEIDIFNYENKIYTDMCYPLEINGKNLILEDRFNYLYPSFSFCESNCIYNNTDFISERINCYCSPKDEINLERPFQPLKSEVDTKKMKDNQKGIIFKCLSKLSNLSKNLGFFYGLIIFLIEIGMVLLTLLYSYKIFNMRIKRKFDINGNDKYSIDDSMDSDNDNDNAIENEVTEKNMEANDKKKKKKINNGPIKTTERNLKKNPPKKTGVTNDKSDKNKKDIKKKVDSDKKGNANNVISIKKVNKNKDFEEKISSSNYPDMLNEKSTVNSMKDDDEESLLSLIKSEEALLRVDYEIAMRKDKSEALVIILTEILDKIYLLKSTWLLQKYEIFSLNFSLYALWHMMMISFLCLFYTNDMLHKIWTKENYPNMGYYLAFGLVVSIIVFVVYKGLTFLINNDLKIKEIEMTPASNTNEISQKYSKMISCSKIKLAIYYVLQFAIIIIFFLYLMVYCYLYSATQTSLIESYLIALIEVVVIKVIYGLILGILRKVSLAYGKNKLYGVVRFLDLYIA